MSREPDEKTVENTRNAAEPTAIVLRLVPRAERERRGPASTACRTGPGHGHAPTRDNDGDDDPGPAAA